MESQKKPPMSHLDFLVVVENQKKTTNKSLGLVGGVVELHGGSGGGGGLCGSNHRVYCKTLVSIFLNKIKRLIFGPNNMSSVIWAFSHHCEPSWVVVVMVVLT